MGNPAISEDRHLDIAIDVKSKSSVDNLKYSPNLHTEKIHKIVQQQYEVTFVQPSVANASNGGHIQTGNIKVLYQLRNGKLIVIGPHWVYSLIMLVVIITVGISFVVKACNDVGSWKHGIGGFVCTVATVGNFVICVLQDPGIVRPHQTLKNNKLNKYTVNSNALNNDRENGNVRHAFIDKLELTNQQSSLKYCEEKTENSEKLNNKEQIKNSYIQMIPMSASSSIDTLISSVPKPSQQLHSLYGIVTAGNMDKNLKRVRANNNKSRKKGKQTIHEDSKMPIGKTQVSSDLCPICQINCSTDTIHCSDCGVCIMGCDHHCPWTSKCVGKNNQTTFYSWIIVSTISALYMTIVMGIIHTTENSVLVLRSNYTQA